jgi:nitric-oxide synthase
MYLKTRPQRSENSTTDTNKLLIAEAAEFLLSFHVENDLPKSRFEDRFSKVKEEIIQTGTYHQTFEELTFGAKVTWRNSTRCIGRIFWESLIVRDYRHLTTAKEIFSALVDHIETATENCDEANKQAANNFFQANLFGYGIL